jgi:hypothetical protein
LSQQPSLRGRIVAHFHHEVPADALAPYVRAGRLVYDLRADLADRDLDASVSREEDRDRIETANLCGWNAFALQVLGDRMLAADAEHDPLTAGFVDRLIAQQALTFYGQVAGWLSRARRAAADPVYALDVAVPAVLPPWEGGVSLEEGRGDGGDAGDFRVGVLLDAADNLRRHAEGEVWDADLPHGSAEQKRIGRRIGQLIADAGLALDYAHGLGSTTGDARRDQVAQARAAVERYYLAGQLVSMPALALEPLPAPPTRVNPGVAAVLPSPGERGFDKWCLSAREVAAALKRDRRAGKQIDELWDHDSDPARTLAVRRQIDSALIRGDIAYEPGHFADCPWSPIWLVKRPVRIARRTLDALTEFTFVVGPRQVGGRFRREIVTGPFAPWTTDTNSRQ